MYVEQLRMYVVAPPIKRTKGRGGGGKTINSPGKLRINEIGRVNLLVSLKRSWTAQSVSPFGHWMDELVGLHVGWPVSVQDRQISGSDFGWDVVVVCVFVVEVVIS